MCSSENRRKSACSTARLQHVPGDRSMECVIHSSRLRETDEKGTFLIPSSNCGMWSATIFCGRWLWPFPWRHSCTSNPPSGSRDRCGQEMRGWPSLPQRLLLWRPPSGTCCCSLLHATCLCMHVRAGSIRLTNHSQSSRTHTHTACGHRRSERYRASPAHRWYPPIAHPKRADLI
jgi:hypothetical protein